MNITRRSVLAGAVAAGVAGAAGRAMAVQKGPGFKIGVCDWMTPHGGSPEILRWCAELGLDGAMVSFGDPSMKFDLRKKENQQAYLDAARKHGAAIASLGMGVLNNIPYKSDPRTEQWVADSIEVARALGVNVVLLAFFAKGDLKNDKAGTDEVVARLKRVMPLAEKAGVYLGIESWLSAEEHVHILDRVASPRLTCYYDVGNSFKMGYDIYKEIRWLGLQRICEFHAKDYAAKGFGNGEVDFWEVRRAMDDIGYRGWFHLEGPSPFGLVRTYRHDRHFLKSLYPDKV